MNVNRISTPEKIDFYKRNDTLTHKQDQYYQDLFYRVLKIGTEIEFARPRKVDVNELRSDIERLLKPSKDLTNLGELGVFDVVKDHCGVEVQVIGRHPHWHALLDQYYRIVSVLLEKKVRIRPTCGLHFHLIAVGLSETIPEIILANLWNLIRRHAPGLKFLFSGGNVRHGLCRRRQHNPHQEFMALSPDHLKMAQIKEKLKNSMIVPEHQNVFNLEHVEFNGNGNLNNFHIELRFPDGDLSPTSIVAKTFLFFALVLKAVEISKYGLIKIGDEAQWRRKNELLNTLSNNDGDLARSDTSGIEDAEVCELQDNAEDLLIFLKSTFNKFTNPAYTVLKSLAAKPISFRRIEKDDWIVIENDLGSGARYPQFIDQIDTDIIKTIELGLVRNKDSVEQWLRHIAVRIKVAEPEIKMRIDRYIEKYPIWDSELGSFAFLR